MLALRKRRKNRDEYYVQGRQGEEREHASSKNGRRCGLKRRVCKEMQGENSVLDLRKGCGEVRGHLQEGLLRPIPEPVDDAAVEERRAGVRAVVEVRVRRVPRGNRRATERERRGGEREGEQSFCRARDSTDIESQHTQPRDHMHICTVHFVCLQGSPCDDGVRRTPGVGWDEGPFLSTLGIVSKHKCPSPAVLDEASNGFKDAPQRCRNPIHSRPRHRGQHRAMTSSHAFLCTRPRPAW